MHGTPIGSSLRPSSDQTSDVRSQNELCLFCTGAGQEEIRNQKCDHGPISLSRRGQLGEAAPSAHTAASARSAHQAALSITYNATCRWQTRSCTPQGYILVSVPVILQRYADRATAVYVSHNRCHYRGLFAKCVFAVWCCFQDQTEALRAALLEVAQKSTEVGADSSRFPDGWLFSHRCACFLHIVAHALRQMPGASAVDVQVGKQTMYTSAAF